MPCQLNGVQITNHKWVICILSRRAQAIAIPSIHAIISHHFWRIASQMQKIVLFTFNNKFIKIYIRRDSVMDTEKK